MQNVLRTLSPVTVRVLSDLFFLRDVARAMRPPSSVISLFRDMSSISIPLFFANKVANSEKPESVKLHLISSRSYSELFCGRNFESCFIPSTLSAFSLRETSLSVVLCDKYSANVFKPSSLILLCLRLRNFKL